MTKPEKIVHNYFTEWLFDSQLHRENGPAIVWISGHTEWLLFNQAFTEEEFVKRVYHD